MYLDYLYRRTITTPSRNIKGIVCWILEKLNESTFANAIAMLKLK